MHFLIHYWFHRPFSRYHGSKKKKKEKKKTIDNNQINQQKLNILNKLINVTLIEHIYKITNTKSEESHINIMKQSPLASI